MFTNKEKTLALVLYAMAVKFYPDTEQDFMVYLLEKAGYEINSKLNSISRVMQTNT